MQKELIDNIGNYILLCEQVNKSIQNKYIIHKVTKYKAIISKDILLQTQTNKADFKRFENEQGSYIKDRQKDIAYLIQKNLSFGRVLIKN